MPATEFFRTARRILPARKTIAAFLGGIAVALGVGAIAAGHGLADGMHGHASSTQHSPDEINRHIEHMLKHFYAEIDATDAQRARIEPLVKQAATELMPLHDRFHASHADALNLLAEAPDRAALERFRAGQMQAMDQASRRLTQLIADVSDVLTPTQRKQLAEHIAEHHHLGRG
ncbi:Spy/CpxP family protein refolding chaperone [Niveibacterium sp.]|uniref:Spy/CpxP family protein refolding chaperone n=1 Tax=Niveibacterium sp. TaxID=2017444 RepID=UPI0035AE124E